MDIGDILYCLFGKMTFVELKLYRKIYAQTSFPPIYLMSFHLTSHMPPPFRDFNVIGNLVGVTFLTYTRFEENFWRNY